MLHKLLRGEDSAVNRHRAIIFSHKGEQSHVICRKMNGTRDDHDKIGQMEEVNYYIPSLI